MSICVVRIDLDRYELSLIERLVADGIVSIAEAMTHKDLKDRTELDKVLWVRKIQKMRTPNRVA